MPNEINFTCGYCTYHEDDGTLIKRCPTCVTAKKRSDNNARQKRWKDAHAADGERIRSRHRVAARRSYHKKRSTHAGSNSVAEVKAKKELTLKPATLARKKNAEKLIDRKLWLTGHYASLLASPSREVRMVSIIWFREIMGYTDPYVFIPKPKNFDPAELRARTPAHWRFHASDLTKNYHPIK